MMKTICIVGEIFMSGVELKKPFNHIMDIYVYGNYAGLINTLDYRLRYKLITNGTKYYTVEKRV